ncbi:MAG: iron-sulfur cluster repair di-iron protein [Nitrospinales bacterium]
MNDQNLTSQNKVSDFVNKYQDHAIDIFYKSGIDFCCGGTKSLETSCKEKDLDQEKVLNELINLPENSKDTGNEDWTQFTLTELIDNIESIHHKFLDDALPQLTDLITKVISAHGKNHPELYELEKTIADLNYDLEPHLMKEERVLFQMLKDLEGSVANGGCPCDSVENPIKIMIQEHDAVAVILQRINTVTNNFSPPEDACETYKLLFKKLREVETDTHLHIHKENNLLFPKALNEVASHQ